MIGRIHGEVVEKSTDSVIVDVGGVGYEITLTSGDFDACKLSEPITLYTHFHVRENSQELFGFKEAESKKLFELLTSVSGVGPKMAMNLLSLGNQRQIRQAIAGGNVSYVSGASGVGKRLAERVVVDLKDKVGVMGGEVVAGLDGDSGTSDDAVEALVALGYSQTQAVMALSKVDPKAKTEDRVKQALKDL